MAKAKAKHPDDDLFGESTMSFGDHLEELRSALFRSVIGLMIGMALGLTVADYVVEYIKLPLAQSLEDYYINKSIDRLGAEHPEGPEGISQELKDFIHERRLVSEKQYIEASEISRLRELHRQHFEERERASEALPEETAAAESLPDLQIEAAPSTEAAPAAPEYHPGIIGEPLPPPSDVMLATRSWKPIQTVVKALNAQEVFMIWMKAGLVVGAILASPYIFYQIWNFVAAGLYPHEKRYVHIYLPFSIGLFLAGAALCFQWVIPQVLKWLLTFNERLNIDPDPRINEWMGFVLFLPLGFGISFQLPLVMLLLNRIGVLSVELYLAKWRIAVLVIFVVAMVLTPADPVSMLFMAVPLTFLYFGGIALCKWMPRGRNPFAEAYEP